MTTRYGQLTYTSYDSARSAGGWQVKQTAGELTAEETQALVSGVRTALNPSVPLPDYPTPDQIAELPRRLAYQRTAGGGAYWHTVPAGADGTGRPGNVFAHVLLDRTPSVVRLGRPIQRWRSDGWLCPYGPDRVGQAMLPAEVPGAGSAVTKESVVKFALDSSTWRLGTLFGLLDAVSAALDGGAPVVLGAESVDSAAQWIGLVSFLMSPGTAETLNFSTFDSPDQLGTQAGLHLAAIPIPDLQFVPPGMVVIDESGTLSLGELGGDPHQTAGGQAITVTPWSAMAQVALLDAESANMVLDDIDKYSVAVDDHRLNPAWPMAMAVVGREEFSDARGEANGVIAAHSPRGLSPETALGSAVAGALAAMVGTTTADAWNAVSKVQRAGEAAEHADLTYLRRAITDAEWLGQAGLIPVGPRGLRDAAAAGGSAAVIADALHRARAAGAERELRLVDFLRRAGAIEDRFADALGPDVPARLRDPQAGPALVQRIGGLIGPETRLAAASATMRIAGHRDGFVAVSDAVLEWFSDGVTVPHPADLPRATPWDATWTRTAIRGAKAQRVNTGGMGDPADRFARLWWLRICGAPGFIPLAAAAVWDPVALQVAAGGGAALGDAVLPTLLATPDSPAVAHLARDVMNSGTDVSVKACAAVRVTEPRDWVQQGFIESHQTTYSPLWESAIAKVGPERVHPDFAKRMATLTAVAAIASQPYPSASTVLLADQGVAAHAVAELVAMSDSQVIFGTAVIAAALLRSAGQEEAAENAVDDVVGAVLTAAAEQLTTTRDFSEEDEEAAATIMCQMAGIEPESGALRRNKKMVHKLVAKRNDPQSSLGARMWGNR